MKNFNIIIVFLLLSGSSSFAQPSYPLEMKKSSMGYQFYQGPIRLKMKQVVVYMQPYEQAYRQIKKARSTKRIASILNGAGGLMIAAAVGSLASGNPNWFAASIGAGLVFIAIPVRKKYNKQALKAIGTYNYGLKAESSSRWRRPELEFLVESNKVGFMLRF